MTFPPEWWKPAGGGISGPRDRGLMGPARFSHQFQFAGQEYLLEWREGCYVSVYRVDQYDNGDVGENTQILLGRIAPDEIQVLVAVLSQVKP